MEEVKLVKSTFEIFVRARLRIKSQSGKLNPRRVRLSVRSHGTE